MLIIRLLLVPKTMMDENIVATVDLEGLGTVATAQMKLNGGRTSPACRAGVVVRTTV